MKHNWFGLFVAGQAVSALGTGMSIVVVPTVAYSISGSAGLAGTLVGTALVVRVLSKMPMGVLADRLPRKETLVAAELARCFSMGALASALAHPRSTYLTAVLLFACMLVEPVADNLSQASEVGALPYLVSPEKVASASSMLAGRSFLGSLIGPGAAGVLLTQGIWLPVLVDSLTYGIAAVSIIVIPRNFGGRGRRVAVHRQVYDGLRRVLSDPVLRLAALTGLGLNLAFTGATTIVVLHAAQEGAPGRAGISLTIAAAGGLLGALGAQMLKKISPSIVLSSGFTLMVISIPAIAISDNPFAVGCALAVGMAAGPICGGFLTAYQLRTVPDEFQGTVTSASGLLSSASTPLGPFLAGWALQFWSLGTAALLLGVALALAVGTTAHPSTLRRLSKELELAPSSNGSATPNPIE